MHFLNGCEGSSDSRTGLSTETISLTELFPCSSRGFAVFASYRYVMIISGSFKHKLVTVSPTAAEEKPASPARVCREHMADGHLHPPSSGFFCVAVDGLELTDIYLLFSASQVPG